MDRSGWEILRAIAPLSAFVLVCLYLGLAVFYMRRAAIGAVRAAWKGAEEQHRREKEDWNACMRELNDLLVPIEARLHALDGRSPIRTLPEGNEGLAPTVGGRKGGG